MTAGPAKMAVNVFRLVLVISVSVCRATRARTARQWTGDEIVYKTYFFNI